jgi:dTDP-4-dehydrorhamnose 3,5-epimerase
MFFSQTRIQGAFIVQIDPRADERGFFARGFCRKEFEAHGLKADIAQANIGMNRLRGTLRGLHYQIPPHAEAKLVRCTAGALFDVIVDLRPGSSSYKQWVGVELNAENRTMLYVPEGCAHGYLTLADDTEVFYLVSQYYYSGAERGVKWDDPAFAVDWPMAKPVVLSDKDASWPDWIDERQA